MAAYITDKNIINMALTDRGIELISNKIESYGHVIFVEKRSDCVLIQVPVGKNMWGKTLYSNTVGIPSSESNGSSLYINPIANNKNVESSISVGESVMFAIKNFIESEMISLLREEKIQSLGL